MARRKRVERDSTSTSQAIEVAAIELIYEKGYHGTSIRDIAGAANVGIATLFHHYPNKAEILKRMVNRGFDELLAAMDRAVADVGDPSERLGRAVWIHVHYHCEHRREASIVASELRSLEGPGTKQILAKRDRVLEIVAAAVEDGVTAGMLDCDHPRVVARAINAMCSGVTAWYREGAGLTSVEIADLYTTMALRMAGASPEAISGAHRVAETALLAK